MIKIWQAAVLAAVLAPTSALAQSGFNGTWKVETKGAKFADKPDVYLLKDGVYSCKSCAPSYSIKADGKPQAISGSPYYDHATITVAGPDVVKAMRTKAGRETGEAVLTASPDGKTLSVAFTDLTVPASPVKGVYTETRVAPAAAGAHPISGSWRQTGFSANDASLLTSFDVKDGWVAMKTPVGQSYHVKLNGPAGPYVGDPGVTTVAVASSSPSRMVESDYRNGKLITVVAFTLAPDGRKVVADIDDKLHGSTSSFTAMKQ